MTTQSQPNLHKSAHKILTALQGWKTYSGFWLKATVAIGLLLIAQAKRFVLILDDDVPPNAKLQKAMSKFKTAQSSTFARRL